MFACLPTDRMFSTLLRHRVLLHNHIMQHLYLFLIGSHGIYPYWDRVETGTGSLKAAG